MEAEPVNPASNAVDKAVDVLVGSGVFGHKDRCGAKAFRKAMEE